MNQNSDQTSSKKVNDTMHWPQSHPPYGPSYPSSFFVTSAPEYVPGTTSVLLSVLPLYYNQPHFIVTTTNNIPFTSTTNSVPNTKQLSP
jgi:hypothetical protein